MKMFAVTFIGENDRGVPAQWPQSPQPFDNEKDETPTCDAIMTEAEYAAHKSKLWPAYNDWKTGLTLRDDRRVEMKAQVTNYILGRYSLVQQSTLAFYGRREVFDWISDVLEYYHVISDQLKTADINSVRKMTLDLSQFDAVDPRVDLRVVLDRAPVVAQDAGKGAP